MRFWMSLTVINPRSFPFSSTTGSFSILWRWRISSASRSVVPTGAVTRLRDVIRALTGCITSGAKRRSRFVRMPTSVPSALVIGTPLMWYVDISSSASETSAAGGSVTGSTIIPASERLTLSTSATCASIERLRCNTPIPPSRASAIASRASVTVSIAAETIGIANSRRLVSRVRVETSFGRTRDSAGTSSTSSNVSPSLANFRSSSRSRSTSRWESSSSAIERWYQRPPTALLAVPTRTTDVAERQHVAAAAGPERQSRDPLGRLRAPAGAAGRPAAEREREAAVARKADGIAVHVSEPSGRDVDANPDVPSVGRDDTPEKRLLAGQDNPRSGERVVAPAVDEVVADDTRMRAPAARGDEQHDDEQRQLTTRRVPAARHGPSLATSLPRADRTDPRRLPASKPFPRPLLRAVPRRAAAPRGAPRGRRQAERRRNPPRRPARCAALLRGREHVSALP